MPRRREAAPKKASPTFNITIPTLLGILSLVFTMWSHLQTSSSTGARESGQMQQFREHEAKTDENTRQSIQRVWDRLMQHMQESESQHREMRRDFEAEFRRDIDANCGQCTNRERHK